MIGWLKDLFQTDAVAPAEASVTPGAPSETLARQLALVIDLNVCVGCNACVTSCKEWNTSGSAGPLSDQNAYAAEPILIHLYSECRSISAARRWARA